MAAPIWITPAGSLGIIPELEYFQLALDAYDSAGGGITYSLVAGALPRGLQLKNNGDVMGIPVDGQLSGVPTAVALVDTSSFTIRATNILGEIADRTFSITIAGIGSLNIVPDSIPLGSYVAGNYVAIQLDAQAPNQLFPATFRIKSGSLPPGLNLTSTGLISGYLEPIESPDIEDNSGLDGSPWDVYPFDFIGINISKYFDFVVEADDGIRTDIQPYNIYVEARITADFTIVTVDNDTPAITVDIDGPYSPVLYNESGFIGNIRQDTNWAYKLVGRDFTLEPITYNLISGSLPANITLNSNTGWISGYVPPGALVSTLYTFSANVSKVTEGQTYTSQTKTFSLRVLGDVEDTVIWLTDGDLGTIYNGAISNVAIEATTVNEAELLFRLSNAGSLPAGLQLLPDGTISGRVTFETFQLDGDGTTIDGGATTFDLEYEFEVQAYDESGYVFDYKTFNLTIIERDQQPYENLYIQILPSKEQRDYYKQIIDDGSIFIPNYIYRPLDPWWGKNTYRRSVFMTGLNPAVVSTYIDSMTLNHYWKTLTFGDIKTAQALDENFEIIYEVVYIELVDNGVNAEGLGPNLSVTWPENQAGISTVYPNSFPNMIERVGSGVGYENRSVLPAWMTSKQTDGSVLGFTRALVLCYAKPNRSAEIAYRLQTSNYKFNLIDFTIDRYEWDHILSDNFSKEPYAGTGTITTSTTSNVVVGVSTDFENQTGLIPGKTIFVSNTAIGVVDTVSNANALILTSNASSNNSGVSYTYTSNIFIINNFATGTGTITANTSSNIVTGYSTNVNLTGTITGTISSKLITGNNTAFNTELYTGKPLIVANAVLGVVNRVLSATSIQLVDPLANTVVNVNYQTTGIGTKFVRDLHIGDTLRVVVANVNVNLGTVANITSNTQLILTSNAQATVSNVAYLVTATTPYTVPTQGDTYLKFPKVNIIV